SCRGLGRGILSVASRAGGSFLAESRCKPIECEIDDGRCVQREQLAENESADDRNAQWSAQLGSSSTAERQWKTGEQRCHRGHHDRPESQQAGLIDRIRRGFAFMAL